MCESKHLRARCGGNLRSLLRRRVRGLVRARRLVLAEGRLVHEQIGALREVDVVERRRGVAGHKHLASRPRLAEHVLRRDDPAVRELDRLTCLEPPPVRPRRHAERVRRRDVEASRPLLLDERVTE